ncbi:3-phosphoshikimate 1-carboxyvinyltransferase [Olivibacter sp. XZL3]|uniref:3-phosphoshikimate 1-carboxyvinyltransferase n=1 Tax=Olivibacter sp. XZL3 TaxID=1735116 RepID=UPI0010658B4A|nr:3-phosphoshikimate 1-carboxyvinyltransferase [Olivibacter sp. XZL3]
MNTETLSVSYPGGAVHGTVQLTGSKSESNRALILSALSKGKVRIENLSNADDTVTLQAILEALDTAAQETQTINVGPAGTAMRFLTAYLSTIPGNFLLTGSERMKQRPIGILVDALKSIGADIRYAEQTGYPPLEIKGGFIQTQPEVVIKGDVSSQYLSALLLVAAFLPEGLTLNITGTLTSKPYVSMTLDMLNETGISHEWQDNRIAVGKQQAKESVLRVEPDWSAASYWYSVIALSPLGSSLFLPGLKDRSLQGDRAIVDIMANFGVRSTFENRGVKIEKTEAGEGERFFDLKECPDLAQTVITCCAALGYDASFTGLETLKIKETDRILALQNELAKFGVELLEDKQVYHVKTAGRTKPKSTTISTYEDHRMAMAFAPLALVFEELIIEDPAVVGKSYPAFWEHLTNVGFELNHKHDLHTS